MYLVVISINNWEFSIKLGEPRYRAREYEFIQWTSAVRYLDHHKGFISDLDEIGPTRFGLTLERIAQVKEALYLYEIQ